MARATSDQRSAGGRNAARPLAVGMTVTVRDPFGLSSETVPATVVAASRGGKVVRMRGEDDVVRTFRYSAADGRWRDPQGRVGYQIEAGG